MAEHKAGADSNSGGKVEHTRPNDVEVTDASAQQAHLSDDYDHKVSVWKAIVENKWATVWCIYAIWCVVLLSFDVQAAGAVLGIPRFREDFGYEYEGDYVLPAGWQSAFGGAPVAS